MREYNLNVVCETLDDTGILSGGSGGTLNVGGSALTQVKSTFAGTSLGIAELAGGVIYSCTSALSALSIGSAGAGCNTAIFFKVENGAIVTPPANVPLFGEQPTSTGVTYCMAINDHMAVCAPAIMEAQ